MSVVDHVADELVTFLPVATAESLSPVLTLDDVETLRHLHKKSIPENTLRAIASDLAYLEAWHLAATSTHLSWPASEEVVLKFIAHHLFDPVHRKDNKGHGMPDAVAARLYAEERLQSRLPHAPSTVRRRISHWKRLHAAKDLEGVFENPAIRTALKAAVKASDRKKEKQSLKPITIDVLEAMLKTCDRYRANGRRDYALLLVAFGSGGRRRSEMGALRIEDMKDVAADEEDNSLKGEPLYEIYLRQAKRIDTQNAETIIVAGRAAKALDDWLSDVRREFGGTVNGPIFRGVNKWGAISKHGLSPGAVNGLVKARAEKAGLNPSEYSAHGIRGGYLTEARNAYIPLEEAMRHSKHRSYQVASSYYEDIDAQNSKAARLLD
ncbi:MAG: tyrosine-type recombinase/integrase [Pseudomonadota bacterium]